jgi:transcription elongation GreA/GreB family factor
MKMSKNQLLDRLIEMRSQDLLSHQKLVEDQRNLANHDEMKQEDAKDTRAIEANYLAGAQEVRLKELKVEVNLLKEMQSNLTYSHQKVQLGSLVELEFEDKTEKYFITPQTSMTVDGVKCISLKSPIAEAILQLEEGDDGEITHLERSFIILDLV